MAAFILALLGLLAVPVTALQRDRCAPCTTAGTPDCCIPAGADSRPADQDRHDCPPSDDRCDYCLVCKASTTSFAPVRVPTPAPPPAGPRLAVSELLAIAGGGILPSVPPPRA